jgi:DNA-binding NtrC family response regulator
MNMNQRNRFRHAHWIQSDGATHPSGAHLLQVSPVPTGRSERLALAMHFALRFARTAGKEVPSFSEDAARYLASKPWSLAELTMRVCRAVEENEGSLITAEDLGER